MTFLITQPSRITSQKITTTGPIATDRTTLSQLLSPSEATRIINFFIENQANITPRRGSKKLAQVESTNPVLVAFEFTQDIYIFGYGTVLAAFDRRDNSITTIKSDFTTDLEDGVRYGAYAFTCNGTGEKIYRTYRVLNYQNGTVAFNVGATVTGTTSGATALIVAKTGTVATGALHLDIVDGTFQDGEVITDNGSPAGAAEANGTNTYATEEIVDAPYCKRLTIFQTRLLAGNIVRGSLANPERVISSDESITAPYFNNWNQTTLATQGFFADYFRAGEVKDIEIFQNVVQEIPTMFAVFYEDDIAIFRRTIESDGTGVIVQKVENIFKNVIKSGGERGANAIPNQGIHFGNETGEYILRQDGSLIHLTENFDNINKLDSTNANRVYLQEKNLILVTMREQSLTNNVIYWFDVGTISRRSKVLWGEIRGWSIARFVQVGEKLYGFSDTSPKILELLPQNIYDDEGSSISCRYEQPMNIGGLDTIKDLKRIDVGGFLSSNVPVEISFDAIPEGGGMAEKVLSYIFDTVGGGMKMTGYGEAEYGKSGYVVSPEALGLIWTSKYADHKSVYGYANYILQVRSNQKAPYILSYVSAEITPIRQQRKKILT